MLPSSHTKLTLVGWKEFPLKIQGDSIVLTLLNPNMTTKLPYHPPVLGEGIKLKKNYLIKKSNELFLIAKYTVK